MIVNQKRRPGNSDFKFTIEAPGDGVAKNVPHYAWIEVPAEDGGIGGIRLLLHYCKFGTEYMKPTYIWTNLESLINELRHPHAYMCSLAFPCKHGYGYHARLGGDGGRAADAAVFPADLVAFLVQHVQRACSNRRLDNIKP